MMGLYESYQRLHGLSGIKALQLNEEVLREFTQRTALTESLCITYIDTQRTF